MIHGGDFLFLRLFHLLSAEMPSLIVVANGAQSLANQKLFLHPPPILLGIQETLKKIAAILNGPVALQASPPYVFFLGPHQVLVQRFLKHQVVVMQKLTSKNCH